MKTLNIFQVLPSPLIIQPKIVRSETNPFIPVTKKRFISPKPRLISPDFEHICLKLGEKASQRTLLCLAFDGFTFRYAADLVLNSTVSSQIVHLFHNLYIRQLVLCRIYLKTSKGRADVALSKNLRFQRIAQLCQNAVIVLPPNISTNLVAD